VWLANDGKSLMRCFAISTQYCRVSETDRRTDILRQHSHAMRSVGR